MFDVPRALLLGEPGSLRAGLSDLLRGAGYQTAEACGVEEGIDLAAALGLCELALVDAALGGAACRGFVERARGEERFHVMRFLIVLPELSAERVMEALAAGYDDYLSRPLSRAALLLKLRGLGLPARDDPRPR